MTGCESRAPIVSGGNIGINRNSCARLALPERVSITRLYPCEAATGGYTIRNRFYIENTNEPPVVTSKAYGTFIEESRISQAAIKYWAEASHLSNSTRR
jgi:hypothetical protein